MWAIGTVSLRNVVLVAHTGPIWVDSVNIKFLLQNRWQVLDESHYFPRYCCLSKSDQSQLNARKPGFADLYGGLRHRITCQRASHCSTMQLCHCSLGPSCQQPHFNINECQLLTIRHYHSARIFGAHCESQAAAPQLCENPVGGKRGGTKEAAPL